MTQIDPDTERQILDGFDQAARDMAQDIAATAQMNFCFGLLLVTAKILIRIDPEAAASYNRLLTDVGSLLRQQASDGFAALLNTAAESAPQVLDSETPVLRQAEADLHDYIDQLEAQYRLELLDPVPDQPAAE